MQSSASLPLYTLSSPIAGKIKYPATPNTLFHRKASRTSIPDWKASVSSLSNSAITEFNLYELLGVENFSDRLQIKEAYRALQKRCHPDIAGPSGHDMAIVLNEAYALLSDPLARMAYDKELAKVADLKGYTGKPIYSVWLGSESEQRAVFVDEVKCVGCLKCALSAEKTFAVESVYGRARVVAQWADTEDKIQEAINTCPVDCISFVARSDLPAYEYIMSKQPRGRVRIGVGNTVGARSSDTFNEVEKFQDRYMKHKASHNSKESESDRVLSRASAIKAIQIITNWLYWQPPSGEDSSVASQNRAQGTQRHVRSSFKKLKAAAEARKQNVLTATQPEGDYWAASALVLPKTTTLDWRSESAVDPASTSKNNQPRNREKSSSEAYSSNPLRWGIPVAVAVTAAIIVRLHYGEEAGGIRDHIGGSFVLAIVNSSWMHVSLAGVTWYLIMTYLVELFYTLRRK